MYLVPFTNNLEQSVTQGDVLVIGHRKATLSHHAAPGVPVVGAEVADSAYDTRLCGVVYQVHADAAPESLVPPDAELPPEAEDLVPEAARQAQERGHASKAARARQQSMQVYSLRQLEKLDRLKVKPGQLGYMVTHGIVTACKVDADIEPIKVGDLLTTSPTRGHAQKVMEPTLAIGAILGKALASLKEGKGVIPVLVMIQ